MLSMFGNTGRLDSYTPGHQLLKLAAIKVWSRDECPEVQWSTETRYYTTSGYNRLRTAHNFLSETNGHENNIIVIHNHCHKQTPV